MDSNNPAGPYTSPTEYDPGMVAGQIEEIAAFPSELRHCISDFDDEKFATFTLPGQWTVSQVIHHLVDSHISAFMRLKWALTEDNPVIKPYDESACVNLPDALEMHPEEALAILAPLHRRFAFLLSHLAEAQMNRTYHHPDLNRDVPVYEIAALYSWHGRHHMAHIQLLKKDRGWQ
ncbi:MAG: putative metal-dependent hydrolase [Leptospiraceae bacterium]|nr:putative metal-dependent hydrolase [Leptospiraceae bacterium]